jgi:hypothetical protein
MIFIKSLVGNLVGAKSDSRCGFLLRVACRKDFVDTRLQNSADFASRFPGRSTSSGIERSFTLTIALQKENGKTFRYVHC